MHSTESSASVGLGQAKEEEGGPWVVETLGWTVGACSLPPLFPAGGVTVIALSSLT